MHLEPHQRIPGYKGHTLLDPLENLEEVCISCFLTDHKDHEVVSMKEECELVIGSMNARAAHIQRMKEGHSKKIHELEKLVKEAKMQEENCVQDLRNLVHLITVKQSELVDMIEKRFQRAFLKCEGLIGGPMRDINKFDDRKLQLERLSKSDDHHDVIQKFPTLSAPLHIDRTHASVPIHRVF